jgi:hypothetical protein
MKIILGKKGQKRLCLYGGSGRINEFLKAMVSFLAS